MSQMQTPLEPEQQLAAVWGLSSPLAGTPTPARQGNAARVRTNPGQPSKLRKGLGKGTHKSSQAKRSREQEAEEEFWMDQDQPDEETIRRTLRLLVRAASRHEAIDITGSGSLLRLFPRSGSSRSDRYVGPGQPGLAPAIRSRHSDNVITGDTMGCSPSRVEDQTRQDRERRQCSPDSRGGPLDHADSAPGQK